MRDGQPADLADEIIPDCVDETLFYLLNAIDQGLLKLSFTTSSGKTVGLTEVGESEMGRLVRGHGWMEGSLLERKGIMMIFQILSSTTLQEHLDSDGQPGSHASMIDSRGVGGP